MRTRIPPRCPLVKAVARAHSWYEMLVSGKACTVRALASQAGLHEVYVTRILKCAYLAQDIVEAILYGRQPEDLTLQWLCCAPYELGRTTHHIDGKSA